MIVNNSGTVLNPILFDAGMPQLNRAEKTEHIPEAQSDTFVSVGAESIQSGKHKHRSLKKLNRAGRIPGQWGRVQRM